MFSKKTEPARLHKVTDQSKLDCICMRICPYVIVLFLFIMLVLILYAFVRYGHMVTGTEANTFYYHLGDV